MLVQQDIAKSSDVLAGLESLLEAVAIYLSARTDGTGPLLAIGTVQDTIGAVRSRLALCRALASGSHAGEVEGVIGRLQLETLIRIVHLGGAEFYTARRTAELFDLVMEDRS